jgi:hypothetical protein
MKHIYKKLDKILEEFKKINQTNKFFPNKYDMDYTLSEEMLSQIMINGDLAKANSLDHNDNRIILNNSIFYQIKLKEMLGEETGVKRKYSGFFWYPPDAFCGWHTNNNCEGERIYFAWAAEDKKSFFRYKDPETGEIITDWDKKGWQHRKFVVSKNKPFWHCVGSKTNRISIGLNVDKS